MHISEAGQLQMNRLHKCSRLNRGCLEQGSRLVCCWASLKGGWQRQLGELNSSMLSSCSRGWLS